MAELNIKKCQIGDVTVLDMAGRITIGEGALALRMAIRGLIEEGKKKILLNLSNVRDIDSSGRGELVANYIQLNRAGGDLRIAHLTDNIQDLLCITKLLTVFEVYETVEEAVKAFAAKDTCVSCVVNRCNSLISFSVSQFKQEIEGICLKCGTQLFMKALPSSAGHRLSIISLRFPTYEGEHISVEPGTPTTIRIDGRLDLFASELLERAWLTIPPPRRVIFCVGSDLDISGQGMQRLLGLCANRAEDSASVILTSSRHQTAAFSPGSPVYYKKHNAVAALGGSSPSAEWILEIRR